MHEQKLPSVETYYRAFQDIRPRLTPKQIAMLAYHFGKRRAVTANELAEHVGFSNYGAVNLQYGRVGTMLREANPAIRALIGQKSQAFAWFDKIPRIGGGYEEWIWSLHEPVVKALKRCSWLPKS